jgi:hypothetical protein
LSAIIGLLVFSGLAFVWMEIKEKYLRENGTPAKLIAPPSPSKPTLQILDPNLRDTIVGHEPLFRDPPPPGTSYGRQHP